MGGRGRVENDPDEVEDDAEDVADSEEVDEFVADKGIWGIEWLDEDVELEESAKAESDSGPEEGDEVIVGEGSTDGATFGEAVNGAVEEDPDVVETV